MPQWTVKFLLSVLEVYTVLLALGQDEKASVAVALAVAEVDVFVAVEDDDAVVVADGETEAL
jgi:hypothetical protein